AAVRLAEAVDALDRATAWMQAPERDAQEKLDGATPYLRLFALAAGGAGLADNALASLRGAEPASPSTPVALARFFMENLVPAADGLALVATEGAGALGAEAEAVLAV
ncbi:acyl-CoA dehydrogenase C-terminal domain-containing protein, partial [Methylopila musalis]